MSKTESVSLQMEELLNDYVEEVQQVLDESIEEVSQKAVEKLRSSSPVGATGRYAKGWDVKKDGTGRVVYNKTDYQLTHLLENGHAIVNQYGKYGRVEGVKHIKPVEDWAVSELPVRISRGLS